MARSEAGLMPDGQDGVPHHSHWLGTQVPGGPGQPSRSVAYYDAASLYPSSGEFFFFFLREEVLSFMVRERDLSFLTLPKRGFFLSFMFLPFFNSVKKKVLIFLRYTFHFFLLFCRTARCSHGHGNPVRGRSTRV